MWVKVEGGEYVEIHQCENKKRKDLVFVSEKEDAPEYDKTAHDALKAAIAGKGKAMEREAKIQERIQKKVQAEKRNAAETELIAEGEIV